MLRRTLEVPNAAGTAAGVCALVQSMDGVYYDELKRLLTEFGDLESANARDSAVRRQTLGRPTPRRVRPLTDLASTVRSRSVSQAAMAAVVTAASRINRDIESDDFLSEHSSVFEEPRPFTPELLGNNTVRWRPARDAEPMLGRG